MRAGLLLLLALACLPARAALQVRDGLGTVLTLPRAAQRVVVLVPHAVETLYAIGAGKQLLAAVDYSDYPPAAQRLPRVGGYSGFNLEAILRLRPDLVIAWRDGGGQRELARLRQLGVPLYISAPTQLDDVAREMRQLGVLTGQQPGAERAARDFSRQLDALRARYRGVAPLSVFVQVSDTPIFTVSDHSFLGALLQLCGGRNVFAAATAPAPQVSVEAVVAARPQLMLAFDRAVFQRWQRWPQLPAVRDALQYTLPADIVSRPGPRLLQGAQQVCGQLDVARRKLGLTPP